MRAIIIKQFGGLDGLVIENLPDPVPQPAKPARVLRFDDIREAHQAMESNQANGKMVVRV